MADQNQRNGTGTASSEGGRAISVDSSPEGDMMSIGTITAPAPLPADRDRDDTMADIDDRAADDARMEVRRREHSGDGRS